MIRNIKGFCILFCELIMKYNYIIIMYRKSRINYLNGMKTKSFLRERQLNLRRITTFKAVENYER